MTADNEELAVSVCRAPLHTMERGIAVPISEGCPHVPKRLRLTRNQCRPHGVVEHDLIRSERDVPPPMCPLQLVQLRARRHWRGWMIRPLDSRQGQRSHDLPVGLCRPRRMWTITIHRNQVCSRIFSTRLQAKWRMREIQADLHCTTSRTPKQ